MKELKAWLDSEMNYALEASVDCETDREKGYAAGRIKSLQLVEEFIRLQEEEEPAINLEPTEQEWCLYMETTNRIPAIKAWKDRTGRTLQEATKIFPYRGPVHDKTDQPK